jgi:hypothetical protein
MFQKIAMEHSQRCYVSIFVWSMMILLHLYDQSIDSFSPVSVSRRKKRCSNIMLYHSFHIATSQTLDVRKHRPRTTPSRLSAIEKSHDNDSINDNNDDEHHQLPSKTKTTTITTTTTASTGDKLRAATGIRPSLHPMTINAIADALKARAQINCNNNNNNNQRNTTTTTTTMLSDSNSTGSINGMVFRVSETVRPLDVALTAGKIAASAISKRRRQYQEKEEEEGKGSNRIDDDNSNNKQKPQHGDDDDSNIPRLNSGSRSGTSDSMTLTPQEEQTIAGRITGVVMRLDDLEALLHQRVTSVEWISTYGEWDSFGVLPQKQQLQQQAIDDSDDVDDDTAMLVDQRIRDDPLFVLNRAECLLGLFLKEVEIPQLQQKNVTVPDQSKIDFLDTDRMAVLLL